MTISTQPIRHIQLPSRAKVEINANPMKVRNEMVKAVASAVIDGVCLGANAGAKIAGEIQCQNVPSDIRNATINCATTIGRNSLQSRVSDCIDRCFGQEA